MSEKRSWHADYWRNRALAAEEHASELRRVDALRMNSPGGLGGLLEEWHLVSEAGWARLLTAQEAITLFNAHFVLREINNVALQNKRCDDRKGDYLCDREPGHEGRHMNWQAVEWSV